MDTILKDKLWKEIEAVEEGIHIEQTGFIPGIGTEVNILRIMEEVGRNMEKVEEVKDEDVWTVFIDLKSAFDTVNH